MAEGSRVRDPVHNFIELTEEEMKLVATPLLQRLRRVRQLAMACLVYPGALHTRFDHTLGVCHVAGLMARQLSIGPHQTRLVRLAALLHDLGHGPFSHVSENVLIRYAKPEAIPVGYKKEKIHELITERLICDDPEILRIVGKDTAEQIAKLLRTGHGPPILRSIVSGPLDADKQDYLLRDGLFCGVQYGVFDIYQLHRSMLRVGPDDEQELMIDPDGVPALEQFVLAKYYLTSNVYRHRVRLVTDQMIVRALILGIEVDGLDELRKLYTFDNSEEFLRRFVASDDSRLLFHFDAAARPNTICGEMLSQLQERRLHKRIFTARIQDFSDPASKQKLQDISKPDQNALRGKIEAAIAEVIKQQLPKTEVDPRLVIVHGFDVKSVRTSSRNDEASIMIACRPEPKPFDQYSTLFASIDEGYADGFLEVYAPISWPTPTDRTRILRGLDQPIREAIAMIVKDSLPQGGA